MIARTPTAFYVLGKKTGLCHVLSCPTQTCTSQLPFSSSSFWGLTLRICNSNILSLFREEMFHWCALRHFG